ncbi:breast cancer type 1 susceptibility protein [Biomphalaria glabrata]|nr:breast cancer type 1 susceptibility protein [Biomphalaria glabrata]
MPLRKMKEELTCPICLELFSNPRRLPCGHSYCHHCIEAMLEKKVDQSRSYYNYSCVIVCPECREELSFDYVRGIEGIPTDFKLSKLVELFHFLKTKDDSDEEVKPSTLTCRELGGEATSQSLASHLPVTSATSGDCVTITSSDISLTVAPAYTNTPGTPHINDVSDILQSLNHQRGSTVLNTTSTVINSDETLSDSQLGAVGGVPETSNRTTNTKLHFDTDHLSAHTSLNACDLVAAHIYSSSPCVSEETASALQLEHLVSNVTNHSDRAHSVPLDAAKLSNTSSVKKKRNKKKSWKSLFVSDSSSTDSSNSDSHASQASRSSTGVKNKRWLMTKFLRSVIFSDSSSSEDDEGTGSNSANDRTSLTKQSNVKAHQTPDSSISGRGVVHSSINNIQQSSSHQSEADQSTTASSNSSTTQVKKPTCEKSSDTSVTQHTRPVVLLAEVPQKHTESDQCLTFELTEIHPTLYDNLQSRIDQPVSHYDNGSFIENTHDSLVRECLPQNNHPACPIESGPRTRYDNISDIELENGPVSPVITRDSAHIPINEIESLKTGFEHMPESLFNNSGSPHLSSTIQNTSYSNCETSQNADIRRTTIDGEHLQEGFGELNSSIASTQGGRLLSPYDNLNTSGTNLTGSHRMSEDSLTSPMVVLTTPNAETDSVAGIEQLPRSYGQIIRTDNDFEFDENYFDTSSEEVSERDLSHLNLAPSSFALDVGEASFSRSASDVPIAAKKAENKSDHKQRTDSRTTKKEDKAESTSEDEEEDDGSHSGTSMLQNKKKPRSRLKKFLTSLLSLSSSDDDDEHFDARTSSSSKSSDW